MIKLVAIISILLSIEVYSKNIGHRASGGPNEYYTDLPENSRASLKKSLAEIQYQSDYLYLEFDIQETYDGKLVVFHDRSIDRMLPYEENQKSFDKLYRNLKFLKRVPFERRAIRNFYISDFKYKELLNFNLKGSREKIQTLDAFLKVMKSSNLMKPVSIDVKYIHSVEAKEKLFKKLHLYYRHVAKERSIIFEPHYDLPFKVGMIMGRRAFDKIFAPHPMVKDYWCGLAKEYGLKGLYSTYSHHDYCKILY
tara:strand:+ start:119208 stop:119963 length:756 start_codon:yes stop_codon:yes gene_type:complete